MRTTGILMAVVVGLGAMALTGCETGDTCDIRTSGIRVTYEAIEEGSTTTARAVFMYKDTPLELGNCGDTITCNGVALSKQGNEIPIPYESAVDPDENGEFVFAFEREDEGPFSATASLPDPFSIDAPVDGEEFSRQEDIDVEWSNTAPGDMIVSVEADDLWEYEEETPDDGAHTIAAGEIEAQSGNEEDDLTADLILARQLEGTFTDNVFDSGSSVTGYTKDSVSIVSIP